MGILLQMLVVPFHVGLVKVLEVTVCILDLIALADGVIVYYFPFVITSVLKPFSDYGSLSMDAVRSCCSCRSCGDMRSLVLVIRRRLSQILLLEDDLIQIIIVVPTCARFRRSVNDEGPELVRSRSADTEAFGDCFVCVDPLRTFFELELNAALENQTITIQGFSLGI